MSLRTKQILVMVGGALVVLGAGVSYLPQLIAGQGPGSPTGAVLLRCLASCLVFNGLFLYAFAKICKKI
jgi:hypothetical protein